NTEFPTMHLARLGRPTRFAYTMRISPEPTLLFDGIVKYDTQTGATGRHWFGAGRWGSEAPFAPRSGAGEESDEDDGYLVSFVQDEAEGGSEVVVLDAHDLGAGPVARVLLPGRVPVGFHACWAPAHARRIRPLGPRPRLSLPGPDAAGGVAAGAGRRVRAARPCPRPRRSARPPAVGGRPDLRVGGRRPTGPVQGRPRQLGAGHG